jgi:DnaJ-class molecular chaperone
MTDDPTRPDEAPADEVPPGTESAGETPCPTCGGEGTVGSGAECPDCDGTGLVVEGVGGG